jgi:lipopolysaccharide export system protein LptA
MNSNRTFTGRSKKPLRWWTIALLASTCATSWWLPVTAAPNRRAPAAVRPAATNPPANNGGNNGGGIVIRSDVQQADSRAQIVVAQGNVRISYPSRRVQARADMAQYFIREKKIVLSGNVLVVQNGSSLEGDNITYLIDRGQFVATPRQNGQVTSIYMIPDNGDI